MARQPTRSPNGCRSATRGRVLAATDYGVECGTDGRATLKLEPVAAVTAG
jgi:hypothetical protein